MSFKVFIFYLASVLPLSNAYALDPCSKDMIVARVCARSINPRAAWWRTFVFDRRDDTGFGKMIDNDFVDDRTMAVLAHTPKAQQVDAKAYEKFSTSFETVKQAYRKLFEQMSEPNRSLLLKQWAQMKMPTREALALTVDDINENSAIDAWYSQDTGAFHLTPLLLNYPDVSQIEIQAILAHEMGHFFKYGFVNESPPAELDACFVESMTVRDGSKVSFRTSTDDEDFADWMAGNVARVLLFSAEDSTVRRERALNWAYEVCEQPKLSTVVKKVKDAVHSLTEQADDDPNSYAKNDDRILTLVQDPAVLSLIGCGPVVTVGFGSTAGHCNLWKK